MSPSPTFHISRRVLWAGLLTATASVACAQTTPKDTTRLSYGEETVATTPAPPDTLLRVQREDRSLWKIGLDNFTISANRTAAGQFYTRYGLPIAYERRIGESPWSVLAEVAPGLVRYRQEAGRPLRRGLEVYTQLAGRYYYNVDRRLRLGRNTTHFSANYVSVDVRSRLLGPQRDFTRLGVLYGLQRRLGRYGFLDLNFGPATSLTDSRLRWYLASNFRIGLAVSSWPVAPYQRRPVPVDDDQSLRPRAYAGVQAGYYRYQAHYATNNPYRTFPNQGPIFDSRDIKGVGVDNVEFRSYYYYVGYYVSRRVAVQIGWQQANNTSDSNTRTFSGVVLSQGVTKERGIAVPTVVRYSLTRVFLNRVQIDALAGLVPVWSSISYREQELSSGQEYGFRRHAFDLQATGGLNASYGFGRRRRIQLTSELMFSQPLWGQSDKTTGSLQPGLGMGLRYRFGYQ